MRPIVVGLHSAHSHPLSILVAFDRLRVRSGDALQRARRCARRDLVPVHVAAAGLAERDRLARRVGARRGQAGEVRFALGVQQAADQGRVVDADIEDDFPGPFTSSVPTG